MDLVKAFMKVFFQVLPIRGLQKEEVIIQDSQVVEDLEGEGLIRTFCQDIRGIAI